MSDIFSLEMGLSSTLAANTRSYTCQDFSKLLATRKDLESVKFFVYFSESPLFFKMPFSRW